MSDLPLISITKAMSSHGGTTDPGALDYTIHGKELSEWLAACVHRPGQSIEERCYEIAEELRTLAYQIENNLDGPFSVSVEMAHELVAKRKRDALAMKPEPERLTCAFHGEHDGPTCVRCVHANEV